MPRRMPREVWDANVRPAVWERDGRKCTHCGRPLELREAHIDHIVPVSKGGDSSLGNLRTLCRRCHVLRIDPAHRGMIFAALKAGIIDFRWREETWE